MPTGTNRKLEGCQIKRNEDLPQLRSKPSFFYGQMKLKILIYKHRPPLLCSLALPLWQVPEQE